MADELDPRLIALTSAGVTYTVRPEMDGRVRLTLSREGGHLVYGEQGRSSLNIIATLDAALDHAIAWLTSLQRAEEDGAR